MCMLLVFNYLLYMQQSIHKFIYRITIHRMIIIQKPLVYILVVCYFIKFSQEDAIDFGEM